MLHAKKYNWEKKENVVASEAREVLFSLPEVTGQEPSEIGSTEHQTKKWDRCFVGNTKNFIKVALMTKQRVICSEKVQKYLLVSLTGICLYPPLG